MFGPLTGLSCRYFRDLSASFTSNFSLKMNGMTWHNGSRRRGWTITIWSWSTSFSTSGGGWWTQRSTWRTHGGCWTSCMSNNMRRLRWVCQREPHTHTLSGIPTTLWPYRHSIMISDSKFGSCDIPCGHSNYNYGIFGSVMKRSSFVIR